MPDTEYDIHPLDRDYSAPPPKARPRERSPQDGFRRFGVFLFIAGLATILLAAIMLGSFRGTGWIEGFGSALHRFGMLAVLFGGISIIASYRLPFPQGRTKSKRSRVRRTPWDEFWLLFASSALLVVLFAAISVLSSSSGAMNVSFIVHHWFAALFCGLMVTLAVWHRGMVRAYAIGSLSALMMNELSFRSFFVIGMSPGNVQGIFLSSLAVIPITGLACAAYVGLVVPKTPSHSAPPEKDELHNDGG